jgi:hypothetical protein
MQNQHVKSLVFKHTASATGKPHTFVAVSPSTPAPPAAGALGAGTTGRFPASAAAGRLGKDDWSPSASQQAKAQLTNSAVRSSLQTVLRDLKLTAKPGGSAAAGGGQPTARSAAAPPSARAALSREFSLDFDEPSAARDYSQALKSGSALPASRLGTQWRPQRKPTSTSSASAAAAAEGEEFEGEIEEDVSGIKPSSGSAARLKAAAAAKAAAEAAAAPPVLTAEQKAAQEAAAEAARLKREAREKEEAWDRDLSRPLPELPLTASDRELSLYLERVRRRAQATPGATANTIESAVASFRFDHIRRRTAQAVPELTLAPVQELVLTPVTSPTPTPVIEGPTTTASTSPLTAEQVKAQRLALSEQLEADRRRSEEAEARAAAEAAEELRRATFEAVLSAQKQSAEQKRMQELVAEAKRLGADAGVISGVTAGVKWQAPSTSASAPASDSDAASAATSTSTSTSSDAPTSSSAVASASPAEASFSSSASAPASSDAAAAAAHSLALIRAAHSQALHTLFTRSIDAYLVHAREAHTLSAAADSAGAEVLKEAERKLGKRATIRHISKELGYSTQELVHELSRDLEATVGPECGSREGVG